MDEYKYFLSGVRNISMHTVYIVINGLTSISPTLLHYVKFLSELKYEDGKYHTYFGDLKKVVGSFFTYWTRVMDATLKESHRLANAGIDKVALLRYITKTIKIRDRMAETFYEQFLPITTLEQQQIYEDLQKRHDEHMAGLYEMKARVEKFDQQQFVDEFARTEFPKSVAMKNKVFLYAHTYIGMLLADHLPEIRGSLLEILQQSRRNLKNLQAETSTNYDVMLHLLYDKNKEVLMLNRRGLHESVETAELGLEIEKIRKRITEVHNHVPISQLQNKVHYYEVTLKEFEQIAATLLKVKAAFESVQREREIYRSRNTTELPGSKFDCWQNLGQQYDERLDLVKENLVKTAKSLLTLFCVRGPNHEMYKDNVGLYYVDEYNHQVYNFKSGLRLCHRDCKGNYRETKDEHVCYYDNKGRFHYDKGEKVYQIMDCTSSYQVGEDTLMKKITVDCGHSEDQGKDCGMKIKDPTDVEILPKADPVDITRTLDSEAVRYLWEGVGAVLPDALYDVGVLQPKNPIHYLAHRLLAHKYGKTKTELREKKAEADAYRARILRERKEQAAEAKNAWRAKQQARCSLGRDDVEDGAAYDLYKATNELICSINYYN